MTTIAYRDGIMASDSGSWNGDACHGWARKLARGADGVLHGVLGNAAMCCAYLAWVDAGCQGEPPPNRSEEDGKASAYAVVCALPNGDIRYLTADGPELIVGAPYYAEGAGAEVALGALFAGATAEQAIEAAKEHGPGAFGRVQLIRRQVIVAASPPRLPNGLHERVERAWRVASEKTGMFQRARL